MQRRARFIPSFLAFSTWLCTGVQDVEAQGAQCPTCADAAALIRRFELPEAASPVRERPEWTPIRKIVTLRGEQWATALRAVAPGVEVVGVMSWRDAMPVIADADVYIGPCVPPIVQAGTRLRWVQLVTAGAEQCTGLPGIADGRILLTNGQGLYSPQIADQAMAMLLALTRRLPKYQEDRHREQWSHGIADARIAIDSAYWELDGRNMLILGLGGIGTEVARRAHVFGMHVRATRNSSREGPDFVEYVGLSNETIDMAPWADVVVNALPATDQTRGSIDARFFQAMKRGSYFVNVGRGETVVTDDLVAALQSSHLAGAGLDVTEPEPLPRGHPLWSMPNVVLTPHSAGASDQLGRRLLLLVSENVRRYVAGERMISVVDPRRGY